jgi:hypothetical protein
MVAEGTHIVARRQRIPASDDLAPDQLGSNMTFRISAGLRDQLVAAKGQRPIGEEIRRRLEASFASAPPGSDDAMFHGLLVALARAATAASKTPLDDNRPAGVIAATGGSPNRPAGPYTVFEASVPLLIDVFRPVGQRSATPMDRWQGAAIAGTALNTMPDNFELMSRLMDGLANFQARAIEHPPEPGSKTGAKP